MSDLSYSEKGKLEELFEMGTGYVCDFNNRTFKEFIIDSIGLDIYDSKYNYESCSKANRLRAFWKQESNYKLGKLLLDLLDYWKEIVESKTRTERNQLETEINQLGQIFWEDSLQDLLKTDQHKKALFEECYKIAARLNQDSFVENIDAIQAYSDDKDFELLAKKLRESIKNPREIELDRLHTFAMKYTRHLCNKHGINYDKKDPLNSIFGGYVKHLEEKKYVESKMSIKILKSSISVLEHFNSVRNNQTFAHDNLIVNSDEAVLICDNICSLIKFIQALEQKNVETDGLEKIQDESDD